MLLRERKLFWATWSSPFVRELVMYSINLSTVREKSAGVAHTSAEVAACFTYPVRPQIATECANPLTPRHR